MLRITIDGTTESIALKLEGKLKGAWVKELERAWYGICSRPERKPVRLDLSGISFVDDRGKAVLVILRRAGAELHAVGPLMTSVIEEIEQRAIAIPAAAAAAGAQPWG